MNRHTFKPGEVVRGIRDGERYTVSEVRGGGLHFKERDEEWEMHYPQAMRPFYSGDAFVLESVYNSPLYQALKEN